MGASHIEQAGDMAPAYVLWFGPTGLAIGRALGRRGVPVIALHDHASEACLTSRYVRAQVLPRLKDDEQAWLDALIEHGTRHGSRQAPLFVASDEHWLFTARHRAALEPYFLLPLPAGDSLEQWPNKSFQYEAAERLGIPYPRVLTPRTRSELDAAASRVHIPCLLKPVMSYLWVRQYAEKLSFVRTKAELIDRGRDALQRGLQFVVQEYIPGNDDDIYGVFAYLDRQSRPLASIVARKIRQYEPRFGSGCISASVIQPRVTDLGLRLVQSMGFHGICSVEFKRDARDGEFKLMEINVRSPLLLSVAIDSGVNLPYIAYCDLRGMPVEMPSRPRIGRRVGLLPHDLHSAKFYRQVGELSRWRWLRSWLGTRELHFAWDDIRPFRRVVRSLVDQWRRGKFRSVPRTFLSHEAWRAGQWNAGDDGRSNPSSRSHAVSAPLRSASQVARAASPHGTDLGADQFADGFSADSIAQVRTE